MGQFIQGVHHVVDCENLYEDVIDMYHEGDIVEDYPLVVKYKGEKAIDDRDGQRDMFSAFWGDACARLFEGAKNSFR